jgi:predicted site-specific integrase-resolvase
LNQYSTREAAKKLGLDIRSIQRYITKGKISAPPVQRLGGGKYRVWTDEDIERLRKILPKIANGRKARYQKKQSGIKQSAKPKSKKKRSKSAKG